MARRTFKHADVWNDTPLRLRLLSTFYLLSHHCNFYQILTRKKCVYCPQMSSSSVSVPRKKYVSFYLPSGGVYKCKRRKWKNMEFGQADDGDDDELIFVDKVSVVSNMQR